jgi:hypothetical protein
MATSKKKKRSRALVGPWIRKFDDLDLRSALHSIDAHLRPERISDVDAALAEKLTDQAVALFAVIRKGELRGRRAVRRADALDARIGKAIEATKVACWWCGTRLTREEFQQAAERHIKERKPTGCIECAVHEKRPYKLEVPWKQARAFQAVIEAHTEAALSMVPDRTMVDVRDDEIAAELFARELKRLKAGGALPQFTWRAVKLGKVKGRRAKPFTVTTGEPLRPETRTPVKGGA